MTVTEEAKTFDADHSSGAAATFWIHAERLP